jgi:D-alanyl-lipoteichoic acid acyltransferase DltB (MBOAT superfamily)
MLFNSVAYLLFFAAVASIHHLLPLRFRWAWLLVASGAFYASSIPAYLAVLLLAALLTWAAGLALERKEGRAARRVFLIGVAANVLLLVFFKYSPFFDAVASAAAEALRLRYPRGALDVILPLGLSFFVFTAVAYLVEIRRGRIRAERHPGILALHFLFFPKLAQGPIERPHDLLPQLREPRRFDPADVSAGLRLMLLGAFKKLVVAERLALYVNAVYGNEPLHNGTSLLVATVFYAFQIYADFSGYTDIALGSARVLGIRLTPNFKRPYLATSIGDFWNRWHISLSTWLRDYVFLPLAYFFSTKVPPRRFLFARSDKWVYLLAVMITFTIAGAWHGETPNYILWGALFGAYLTASNWTRKGRRGLVRRTGMARSPRLLAFLRTLFTFSLVCFAWIFFRGGSLDVSLSVIRKIALDLGRPFLESPSTMIYSLLGIAAILALDLRCEFFEGSRGTLAHRSAVVRQLAAAALVVLILLFGVLDGGQFIYFQF